jgi:hypothetical protein
MRPSAIDVIMKVVVTLNEDLMPGVMRGGFPFRLTTPM